MTRNDPPSKEERKLLDFIGQFESSGGDYNIVYSGYKDKLKKPLTTMTIAEVLKLQETMKSSGSSAVGAHQFINSTLEEEIKKQGVDEGSIFNAELQDSLILNRLKRVRGLDKFLSGEMELNTFAKNLSKEFASLPNPETGKSYYNKSTELNAALTSTDDFINNLERIKYGEDYENPGILSEASSVNPEMILNNPNLDEGTKEELLKLSDEAGLQPETQSQIDFTPAPRNSYMENRIPQSILPDTNETIVDSEIDKRSERRSLGFTGDIGAFPKDFKLLNNSTFKSGGKLSGKGCGGPGQPPCPPVYVDSEKNPRYKAYRDSLNLHNSRYDQKEALEASQGIQWFNKKQAREYNKDMTGEYNHYLIKDDNQTNRFINKVNRTGYLPIGRERVEGEIPLFMKPKQKVIVDPNYGKPSHPIYRKPTKPTTKGVSNITPEKFKEQQFILENIPIPPKQYNLSDTDRRNVQSREEYRKLHRRPNGNKFHNGGGLEHTHEGKDLMTSPFHKLNDSEREEVQNYILPEQDATAINKAAMRSSTAQAKKELAKEQVFRDMQKVYKHPLGQPGMFSPLGVEDLILSKALPYLSKTYKGIKAAKTLNNRGDVIKQGGIDSNLFTRPLTPFGKNELTPGDHLYRKIGGKKGLQDLIDKGGAQAPAPMRMNSNQTIDTPFFGIGNKPNENYRGMFAVEGTLPSKSKYDWTSRAGGTSNYGLAPVNRETDRLVKNIPLEELEVYKKKWFSNNYKKLDKNNLEQAMKWANTQQGAEAIYKWGVRGVAADQIFNDGEITGKAIKVVKPKLQNGGSAVKKNKKVNTSIGNIKITPN